MTVMSGSVHAMLAAMAIMVLPALVICVGITVMAYRRRGRFAEPVAGRRLHDREE